MHNHMQHDSTEGIGTHFVCFAPIAEVTEAVDHPDPGDHPVFQLQNIY